MTEAKRPLCIGLLAHVDSGKTTLAEAIFRANGLISELGRVDHGDAFLDTGDMEKKRGITIRSKIGRFLRHDREWILLDTPGHDDFSPEMERSLPAMDVAVLILSGKKGFAGREEFLLQLLKTHGIPCILFVNKMDQVGIEKEDLKKDLEHALGDSPVFLQDSEETQAERLALLSEELLTRFLDRGKLTPIDARKEFQQGRWLPCIFGSALYEKGISLLLDTLETLGPGKKPGEPSDFSAYVYQVDWSEGQKKSHLRIFTGSLSNKEVLTGEKVHELRRYNGETYETCQQAGAGDVVCLIGPTSLQAGQGLGESESLKSQLHPLFRYELVLENPGEEDLAHCQKLLLQKAEEFPELLPQIRQNPARMTLAVMGPLRLEVLQDAFQREGLSVQFSFMPVERKETILAPALGIGHYEPLRHYAEVHLYLEPGERRSGKRFSSRLSEEILSHSDQEKIREICLREDVPGVLAGQSLTDLHFVLVNGASGPHTSGGDMAEACRRAIRNGLMRAPGRVLEPFVAFRLQVEVTHLGRLLQELTQYGCMEPKSRGLGHGNPPVQEVEGRGPLAQLGPYFLDRAQKQGLEPHLEFSGYEPMEDQEGYLAQSDYQAEKDRTYPPGSIFCSHGAGFGVPWYEVDRYAHCRPLSLQEKEDDSPEEEAEEKVRSVKETRWTVGQDEIDRIFRQTFFANRNPHKKKPKEKKNDDYVGHSRVWKSGEKTFLLVDGYNLLHAWSGYREEVRENLGNARSHFIEEMIHYDALCDEEIIVVFDAYRVKDGEHGEDHGPVHVVYTAEAETADHYIQRFSHRSRGHYNVIVASSDGGEQLIVRKEGAVVYSAHDFYKLVRSRIEGSRAQAKQTGPDQLTQKILDGRDHETK